jgi:hypothetical protein
MPKHIAQQSEWSALIEEALVVAIADGPFSQLKGLVCPLALQIKRPFDALCRPIPIHHNSTVSGRQCFHAQAFDGKHCWPRNAKVAKGSQSAPLTIHHACDLRKRNMRSRIGPKRCGIGSFDIDITRRTAIRIATLVQAQIITSNESRRRGDGPKACIQKGDIVRKGFYDIRRSPRNRRIKKHIQKLEARHTREGDRGQFVKSGGSNRKVVGMGRAAQNHASQVAVDVRSWTIPNEADRQGIAYGEVVRARREQAIGEREDVEGPCTMPQDQFACGLVEREVKKSFIRLRIGQGNRLVGRADEVDGAFPLRKSHLIHVVVPIPVEVDRAVGGKGNAIVKVQNGNSRTCADVEVAKAGQHFGGATFAFEKVARRARKCEVVALAILPRLDHDVVEAGRGWKGDVGGRCRHRAVVPVAGIEPIVTDDAIPKTGRTRKAVSRGGRSQGHVVEVEHFVGAVVRRKPSPKGKSRRPRRDVVDDRIGNGGRDASGIEGVVPTVISRAAQSADVRPPTAVFIHFKDDRFTCVEAGAGAEGSVCAMVSREHDIVEAIHIDRIEFERAAMQRTTRCLPTHDTIGTASTCSIVSATKADGIGARPRRGSYDAGRQGSACIGNWNEGPVVTCRAFASLKRNNGLGGRKSTTKQKHHAGKGENRVNPIHKQQHQFGIQVSQKGRFSEAVPSAQERDVDIARETCACLLPTCQAGENIDVKRGTFLHRFSDYAVLTSLPIKASTRMSTEEAIRIRAARRFGGRLAFGFAGCFALIAAALYAGSFVAMGNRFSLETFSHDQQQQIDFWVEDAWWVVGLPLVWGLFLTWRVGRWMGRKLLEQRPGLRGLSFIGVYFAIYSSLLLGLQLIIVKEEGIRELWTLYQRHLDEGVMVAGVLAFMCAFPASAFGITYGVALKGLGEAKGIVPTRMKPQEIEDHAVSQELLGA